ncbi:MAG: guanylate kinase [Prevotellaceae bacterium]|nr:guanylate kinase [Prevotellaceae bacterium]
MNNIIVISAPSGTGKTTIINHLLDKFKELEFSVSATSRAPRPNEINGKHYYFISQEEFKKRVEQNEFIEWEEVYDGTMYGTPASEVSRICGLKKVALLDLDVFGALNFKSKFKNAFLIFVLPPSLEVLRERLEKRGSESPEAIDRRIEKAKEELTHALQFDYMLLNDELDEAQCEIEHTVSNFLHNKIVPDTFRIVE